MIFVQRLDTLRQPVGTQTNGVINVKDHTKLGNARDRFAKNVVWEDIEKINVGLSVVFAVDCIMQQTAFVMPGCNRSKGIVHCV